MDEEGFHSPVSVLDESHCVSSMFHDECSRMYFTFISLDGVLFTGRRRDFYTKHYKIWAFKKLYLQLEIQCTSGLLIVLKLAKISLSAHELR